MNFPRNFVFQEMGYKAPANWKNRPGAKVVTPEQMELSRVRAENIRPKRENEILKKAAAYFARDAL